MPGHLIGLDEPARDDVTALLRGHLEFAGETSPPEHVHALDIESLQQPDISFYSIRQDGQLLGVGALRELDPSHGEIKSMHTAASARGKGIGREMLLHIIDVARNRGYTRLSLETGTMDAFVAARRLYESAGFVVSEPFGDYSSNDYSLCMTMELT